MRGVGARCCLRGRGARRHRAVRCGGCRVARGQRFTLRNRGHAAARACVLRDPPLLAPLLEGLDTADAFELDAQLRRAVRLAQRLDAELAPLLRQVRPTSTSGARAAARSRRFAREPLGMSPRKARALLRLERARRPLPALRTAYRAGALSWLQAQALAPLLLGDGRGSWREAWVAFAGRVSLRRLDEVVGEALALREADPLAWPRPWEDPERLGCDGSRTRAADVCATHASGESVPPEPARRASDPHPGAARGGAPVPRRPLPRAARRRARTRAAAERGGGLRGAPRPRPRGLGRGRPKARAPAARPPPDLRARRLALHGAGLHVAAQSPRPPHRVPLGGRRRHAGEPDDAVRLPPPARRPRRGSRSGGRRPRRWCSSRPARGGRRSRATARAISSRDRKGRAARSGLGIERLRGRVVGLLVGEEAVLEGLVAHGQVLGALEGEPVDGLLSHALGGDPLVRARSTQPDRSRGAASSPPASPAPPAPPNTRIVTAAGERPKPASSSAPISSADDFKGPVPVAVAGEYRAPESFNGADADAPPEGNPARIVVFGDSDFASNQLIGEFRNRDLFVNSVNWLLGDVEAISVRPGSGASQPAPALVRAVHADPLPVLVRAPRAHCGTGRIRLVVAATGPGALVESPDHPDPGRAGRRARRLHLLDRGARGRRRRGGRGKGPVPGCRGLRRDGSRGADQRHGAGSRRAHGRRLAAGFAALVSGRRHHRGRAGLEPREAWPARRYSKSQRRSPSTVSRRSPPCASRPRASSTPCAWEARAPSVATRT